MALKAATTPRKKKIIDVPAPAVAPATRIIPVKDVVRGMVLEGHGLVTYEGARYVSKYDPSMRKLLPEDQIEYPIRVLREDGTVSGMLLFKGDVQVSEPSAKVWRKSIAESQEADTILSRGGLAITLGADPEIFVVDAAGVVIPAFKWLPPKEAAMRYGTDTPRQGSIFYDGFQAEWTCDPYKSNQQCLSYHADVVQAGMKAVLAKAREFDKNAKLSIASVVPIPRAMVHEIDHSHFRLGCSPSKNVYGESPLEVDDPVALPFRSAGWHMHMGLPETVTDAQVQSAVRMMDAVLGVAGVTIGQAYPYPERRTLYGRAGEYRYTPGKTLEYRVPEVLMGAHPATWNLMWDLGRHAMWLGLKGLEFIWDADEAEVRDTINKGDVRQAKAILQRNEPILRKMLANVYYAMPSIPEYYTTVFSVLYDGIGAVIADPTNIEHNWHLDSGDWDGHNSTYGTTWASLMSIRKKDPTVKV